MNCLNHWFDSVTIQTHYLPDRKQARAFLTIRPSFPANGARCLVGSVLSVLRAGIEPISLAFQASSTITPGGSLMLSLYPCLPLHSAPWNCKYFNDLTQCRFTNNTAHSLYRIIVMATSVTGVMKYCAQSGFEPTSLVFWASVLLPLHHVGSLMSWLYPRLSVYAAPCLRGQCRRLQKLHPTPTIGKL